MQKFRWKPGSRIKRINPQEAGEQLEAIRRQHNGRLNPVDIVEDARPETSPLHNAFEWNDGRAAAQYRVMQAATLIRSIEVVRINQVDCPARTRAFVSILQRGDENRSYISTKDAMTDGDYRRQLLATAKADFLRLRHIYAGLSELADVFAAIDAAARATANNGARDKKPRHRLRAA